LHFLDADGLTGKKDGAAVGLLAADTTLLITVEDLAAGLVRNAEFATPTLSSLHVLSARFHNEN